MKKVGFIGASDKTDLIMYIAKTLENIGNRILVIDATITQKIKYVVPAINPTRAYITDFENVDYAVGFKSMDDMTGYLGINEEDLVYDYILIDIDSEKGIEDFDVENTKENYFVTAFDMYSLKRGVEILKNLPEPMNLSKILYDFNIKKDDEEYLNYLSMDTKVAWNDFSIYIPISDYDKETIEENQRVYRTRIKRLTAEYQEGILYVVQDMVKDLSVGKIKKIIKE